ncbi:MAG: ATP-binding cassette domain-containing protein, partial [Chloroflexi bacterium]|nr:ATP-binding cassette domain-containing protein [Chloroflexota bacterium]
MALLSVTSLSKDFGGLRAIDYVTFSVSPGEILSIIGPNGAGKTTVFNVITGIYPATEGTVVFDGQPIVETHAHQRDRFLRSF